MKTTKRDKSDKAKVAPVIKEDKNKKKNEDSDQEDDFKKVNKCKLGRRAYFCFQHDMRALLKRERPEIEPKLQLRVKEF